MDDILRDFLSEANDSIDALDRALVRFEREPGDPELLSEIFRVMHTIKGTCGFLGLARLAAVAHAGENILGQFRDGALSPTQDSVSAILEAIDLIKALLAHLEAQGAEPAGEDSALIQRLNAIASADAAPPQAQEPLAARVGGLSTIDCAAELALARAKASPEGVRLHGAQDDTLLSALRDGAWGAISGEAGPSLSATLIQLGLGGEAELELLLRSLEAGLGELGVDAEAIAEAMTTLRAGDAPPAPVVAQTAPTAQSSSIAAQTIRVQVEALEQLMNVASELVLIRNQLLQTLRAQPESPFAGPLHRLNHVTTELQESVMTTRMQPIGAAWAKLPRLARDLALELNKRIDVTMQGEETELDRQVLELIKDPLTHMIRNAADHGLEAPGERAKAGKPETGRIMLSARHEGSHIVIEIADDGRGLMTAKLRAKALAQSLITPAEAETLSENKIQQLIFHPGFSTAAQVSGISGRGVGMDVVRTNIEKIGGTVELSSTEGKGTRFTIRIPLTLTIVSALIVGCGGEKFAMPQSSVVELVGVGGGAGRHIEHVNGAPVLRLRDRLLPLVSLQDLMQLDAPVREDERCVLILRVGALSYGVIVDRVFDTEEIVVKPAASVLRTIPYYSGATILGDGAVIMILDPKGIAQRLGAIDASSDDAQEEARAGETLVQLLVMRGAGATLKATPLQLVSRIEEAETQSVEYANGKPVLQYRGRLMPLVALDEGVRIGARRQPVVVFEDETRAIGLVVEEIIDVVETPLRQEFKPSAADALGSLVVADRVTDIIDLAYYWRGAAFDAAPTRSLTQPPTKRALIVDPRPFNRNLIAPLLAMAGYEVTMAESAEAASALIERESFAVIFSDAEAPVRAQLSASAPIIGLYDDPLSIRQRDAEGFTQIACRFDRDAVLATLNALQCRSAA
ncbi:MAG TPA: chemotaxis protein CheA [Terricaulis sp.]|mgnify:CR=1 FL=1|nr:chemotaxis protein CheA [Terricaulis sp.]